MKAAALATLAGALLCVAPPRAVAQGTTDELVAYSIEYSNAPMIRNAALADVTVGVIERGADWILDRWAGDLTTRRSAGGVFSRAAQLSWDVVLEAAGGSVAHEYGHASRVAEEGGSARVVIRPFGSFFRSSGPPLSPAQKMSVFGGGIEGSTVMAALVGNRLYARGTATPGELTLLMLNAVGSELYILQTLSNRRLGSPERFFGGGAQGLPGDPAEYVFNLAATMQSRAAPSRTDPLLFTEVQATARRVRSESLINLLDYELFGASVGLSRDFLWQGERKIPVRWLHLGPMSLAPALRYMLSPNGPERQVRSRYKAGAGTGQAYVRWSDTLPPTGVRLLGAGGEYRHRDVHGFVPNVSLDLWRNPDRTTSVRSELGTTVSRSADDRFIVSAAVGAKGGGYVQGYPLASGVYFKLGAGVRF